MKRFYVIKVRNCEEEYVHFLNFKEAVKNKWIDENGNRIWISPPDEELSTTSVYGFDDLRKAMEFYDTLVNNQIGMKVTGFMDINNLFI